MAEDQDRTVPLPGNPEQQQPGSVPAPEASPAPAAEPAPEPEPAAGAAPAVEPPPAASPTPPPPPAPGQAQPAQPYQAAAPYGQPQQPFAPGQPVNPYGQPMAGYYQQPAKSGKATGALVCGIFAILLAWAPLFGIILGIVAIVLAVKAVKEAGKDGKATGGTVCGIIGIVLSVLSFILYLVIGFGAMAYVAAHPGSVTVTENTPSLSDSGSNSSALGATEDEKQAEAVAQAELDKLKNQDPAFVQQLAAQLDAEFADSAGYSLAELGVDPVAFVQWLLADFDYQLDGTYTNSDGTGTTYADVTMRDVYAFASTFMTDATAFSRSTEAGSMDEAAMKAKLGELFNAAMEKTTDTTESYIGVDLVKQGDAWVIDEESWADETELLFGNL